jgi:hypothetical protein
MRRWISPAGLWLVAGGAVAVMVVLITVGAVAVRPGLQPCHFSCSNQHGPPLIDNTVYTNAKFGFAVEYLAGSTRIVSSDANGVVFNVNGSSQIAFAGSSGTDLDAAIQKAFNGIDTNVFQDLQAVGGCVARRSASSRERALRIAATTCRPAEERASPSPPS